MGCPYLVFVKGFKVQAPQKRIEEAFCPSTSGFAVSFLSSTMAGAAGALNSATSSSSDYIETYNMHMYNKSNIGARYCNDKIPCVSSGSPRSAVSCFRRSSLSLMVCFVDVSTKYSMMLLSYFHFLGCNIDT